MRTTLFLSALFFLAHAPSSAHAATIRELYEQASTACDRGEYDTAIGLYQQVTKQAPRFAPAYVGIGLALKGKGGDIDEVLYYYKTAADMDPTNTQALEQLGRLYYSLNKFDKAEQVFLKALKVDPRLTSVKLSLGWIYLLGGKTKPEMAVKYFSEVVKETPAPNAWFGLGMAYFADNDRPQAMDMITRLRGMGQEDLAKRLEQMVRDNKQVVVQSAPDVEDNVSTDRQAASATQDDAAVPADTTAAHPDTGIKVRLRGKL